MASNNSQYDTTVRLIMAIHNRFAKFTLDQPLALELPTHLETSHSLSSNMDLFVSSLYSPQVEGDMIRGAEGVTADAYKLCDLAVQAIERVGSQTDQAAAAMDKLALDGTRPSEVANDDGLEKEKKWMDVWRQQMEKAQKARAGSA